MKKLFTNRKAVSPVIATVLMIMVTMAGMTILFGFVISYSDSYKAGIGTSVMESLTIEDVWVNGASIQVTIYNAATKANMGSDVDLNVATIYVDGLALINNDQTSINRDTINFNDKLVGSGEHVMFICKLSSASFLLSSGTTHDITIATIRGSNFKDQFNVS
jgi:flagellin-like protein